MKTSPRYMQPSVRKLDERTPENPGTGGQRLPTPPTFPCLTPAAVALNWFPFSGKRVLFRVTWTSVRPPRDLPYAHLHCKELLPQRPRCTGVTDLGPVTLDQRRPGSSAGPHQTCLARARTATTASTRLPNVKFNEPQEKPWGLSVPWLLPTSLGCSARRGRRTAPSERATCAGVHTTHVRLSARTVACGTWALGRERSPPVPSNVILTLATGGFITPILQTRKLRLRSLKRLHRTVQVRLKS